MLNFREELNKIKEEKLKCSEELQEKAESVLKDVLGYFKAKETVGFLKEVELMFAFVGNIIYVKENPRTNNEKEVCRITLDNSEMAIKVLCYIEDKLKNEGFEIASIERAALDGKFSIKIRV